MAEGNDLLFGPNVNLPSLPGLHSTCEEELKLLMNEIELAFQKRNGDLCKESKDFRSLCVEQRDEIENLRSALTASRDESNKLLDLGKEIKNKAKQIASLSKENTQLTCENSILQNQIKKAKEDKIQFENFKRNHNVLQNENKALKEKFNTICQQHRALGSCYQKLIDVMTAFHQEDSDEEQTQMNQQHPPTVIHTLIDNQVERFLAEETESNNDIQSKIKQEIDNFKEKFETEICKF